MNARRVGDTKYAPLLRYLAAVPPEHISVLLTLAEVEAIIGAALPPGARTTGFWSGTGARSLHRAGWRASLAAARDAATFVRVPAGAWRTPRLDYTAILAAHAAGESVPVLARRLGIDPGSVYRALRRAGIPLQERRRRPA